MNTRLTPSRDKKTLRDPLAEAYQLKSMVRSTPECSKQSTLPPLKIMGVTVTGVDPRLINNAKLTISVPLNAGDKRFVGLSKDARLHIQKKTRATVEVELTRNENSQLCIKHCELAFNKSIRIKNPASSLTTDTKKSSLSNKIKDKLADVTLKKLTLSNDGTVSIDGKLIKLRVIKSKLNVSHRVALPNIEDVVLSTFGLTNQEGAPIDDMMARANSATDGMNMKRILERLSSILEHATYELIVKGDASRMSMLKNNIYFRGPAAPLDVCLKGVLHVNSAGDVLITADGSRSRINSSLGNFSPTVEATFSQRGDKKIIDARVDITGTSKKLKVDLFSQQAMINYLPRQSTTHATVPRPSTDNHFNASVGTHSIAVKAHLDIKTQLDRRVEFADANVAIDVQTTNVHGKTMERGMVLNGTLTTSIALDGVRYEQERGVMHGKGHAAIQLEPSASVREKFPELHPVTYNYGLELMSEGRARITPPPFGITRMIRPVINLEGHDERVDGRVAKSPIFPIGTPQYFDQVKKIAGAKLRDASTVKLLIDGKNSLPERLRLINQATDTIYFQTFVFKDDECGRRYAEALVEAKKRGVRVCGIVDSLGNIDSITTLVKPNPIYQFLQDNGVELFLYNGQTEAALRSIFRIAKKHRHVLNVDKPKSLTSVAQIVRFFHRMVLACNDLSLPTEHERDSLKKAIHRFLFGKEDVVPEVAVNELTEVLRDCMTSLDELVMLLKRVGKASYRAHEKYLIVDNSHAIIGGMNIADEYLLGGTGRKIMLKGKIQTAWRDSDVLLGGEIINDIFRAFRRNWLHLAHERLPLNKTVEQDEPLSSSSAKVSFMQNRPLEDGDHKIVDAIIYNLRTLQPGEKAWFETAYFLPRGVLRALQNALVDAAKRGVDVRIITNSAESSDFSPLVHAAVFDVRELLEAGARVYERNDDRLVHAKVLVFGKKLTVMGSWNCDNRSASHDTEDMCSIYDEGTALHMTEVLERDMREQSVEIKLEDIRAQKIDKEFKSAGMLIVGELV